VFGISGDSPAENKAFKEAQKLPYDLLTDENNILRKEFGIPNAMMVLPGEFSHTLSACQALSTFTVMIFVFLVFDIRTYLRKVYPYRDAKKLLGV
jgi:AhpC/TSA family